MTSADAILGFALAIFCACSTQTESQDGGPTSPPNIVFILADDLGYNELSCYGQTHFSTPNIDRLAEEGIRFTDFYAGNTVCAPSRCSLITGKHPGNASVRGNLGWPGGLDSRQRVGIQATDTTLGELLKKASYATAHVGKWHLLTQDNQGVNWPVYRGYDYVMREHFTAPVKAARKANLEANGIRYDPNYPYEMWENGKKIPIPQNASGEQNYLMDDIVADAGMEFIRENKDRPFFVFFSLKIPHVPETLHTLDTLFQDKGWPECERTHAARIVYHDRQVGDIVALIDSLGLGENTVVLYSSDNGGHSEGGYKHPSVDPCKHDHTFFESNAPLRGFKRDLYEGGIRVPFIARWPGTIKGGTVTEHAAAFWDVWPTFEDLTEQSSPYAHDGLSFLPTLEGKHQKEAPFLYWEFYRNTDAGISFMQAARNGKWKGVRSSIDQPVELYNLEEDIGETQNVSAKFPDISREIVSIMEKAHTKNVYYPYGGLKK